MELVKLLNNATNATIDMLANFSVVPLTCAMILWFALVPCVFYRSTIDDAMKHTVRTRPTSSCCRRRRKESRHDRLMESVRIDWRRDGRYDANDAHDSTTLRGGGEVVGVCVLVLLLWYSFEKCEKGQNVTPAFPGSRKRGEDVVACSFIALQ